MLSILRSARAKQQTSKCTEPDLEKTTDVLIAQVKLVMALRSAQAWREYVLVFYWLYKTFEEEVAKIRDGKSGDAHLRATFEAVHDPLLLRTDKIRDDLMFYFDDDKAVLERCYSTEGLAYIAHVKEIAKESPVKLMAYLSVMYLALFAGGQIIRSKMVKRSGFYPSKSGLTHAEVIRRGTNIFLFDSDDTTKMRKTHRARFDRVCLEHLDQAERDEIVEEAKQIFIRNEKLMAEIHVPHAFWLVVKSMKTPIMALLTLCLSIFYLIRYLL